MENINVEQICTITTYPRKKHRWYVYRKKRKFLFWETRKEGFYYTFGLSDVYTPIDSICELEDNRVYIYDDMVIFKPHIEIKMSNGSIHVKFFESVADMQVFLNSDYMKSIKLIDK